jgi:hypothetical protein
MKSYSMQQTGPRVPRKALEIQNMRGLGQEENQGRTGGAMRLPVMGNSGATVTAKTTGSAAGSVFS